MLIFRHLARFINTVCFQRSDELYSSFSFKCGNVRYSHRNPFIMKIETPEFKGIFSPGLVRLLDLFDKHKYEIRIAGGAVRDILLGISPKDVDFATTATPDEMKQMFELEDVRMINMKGEKHGTITARIDNENFEVTTLRIDVTTDGRHAEVQFTKDWLLDANRRDLTINSMFLDREGTLYDYFGGFEDLKKRRVAFVGEPDQRIREDYLRILRYFRFYGRIAEQPDSHEEDTIIAIKNNIEGLSRISGERIWVELSKILRGNFVPSLIKNLIEIGAGPYIGFPENPNVDEFLVVCERVKNLDPHPMTLIAALMNTEKDLLGFHARCKLSSFERDLGLLLIKQRSDDEERTLKSYQVLMLKSNIKDSHSKPFIIELLKYKKNLLILDEFKNWEPPAFPVNGIMLKEKGLAGVKLGFVKEKLRDYWIEKDFHPSTEELLALIPDILQNVKTS